MLRNEIRDWANDYLIEKLGPQLLRLQVTSHWDQLTRWFKRYAPSWSASSQTEFNAVASTRVEQEVRRLNAGAVSRNFGSLVKAVSIGAKTRTPDRVRSHQPDVSEDARQDAFVTLLQTGSSDGRSANIAGQSAMRDAVRRNLKYLPESQLNPSTDDWETLPPWERSIDRESRDFDDTVWKLLREATDINRRQLILRFWDDNPDDMAFLISYLARKGYRRIPASQKERDKAAGIIKRLRRLEDRSDA